MLREALAERHGVRFDEVVVAAGADAVIGYVCQATLDPGDEVVTPWPSFPSYVLDPLKLAAVTVRVELRDGRDRRRRAARGRHRADEARLPADAEQPDGNRDHRATSCGASSTGVPEHVLTVVDEAYFEYVDDPSFPDAIEEAVREGARVLALRTFSKIYGLAGLRVGYGVGPAAVIAAIRKVQRAFDVTTPAQEAALASLDGGPSSPAVGTSTARRWRRSRALLTSVASSRSGRRVGELRVRRRG